MVSITGETLSPQHLKELHEDSAISLEQITERGYETITNPRALPPPFTGDQRRPGLLIPIRDTAGDLRTWQLKPDDPPIDRTTGKPIKYLNPAKGFVCLDLPTAALPFLEDAGADLWITEGAKKVDSAVCHGIPCIVGLFGVSAWQRDGMALLDWKELILKGRRAIIAFDSDVMTNPKVRRQLDDLAGWLTYKGARVGYCLIPPREGRP